MALIGVTWAGIKGHFGMKKDIEANATKLDTVDSKIDGVDESRREDKAEFRDDVTQLTQATQQINNKMDTLLTGLIKIPPGTFDDT